MRCGGRPSLSSPTKTTICASVNPDQTCRLSCRWHRKTPYTSLVRPLKGESEPLSSSDDLERAVNESQENARALSALIEGVIGATTIAMSTSSAPFGEVEDVALPDVVVVGRGEADTKLLSQAQRRRTVKYEDDFDEYLVSKPQ